MRTPNLVIGPDSAGQLEDIERDLVGPAPKINPPKKVKVNQYTGLAAGRKPRRWRGR